ncbi:class I SAM-dependent methyltransferase [Mycoplasmatota bacterium zrk1]
MSQVVKDYYNMNAKNEFERLNNGYSNVEFQSTMYLIEKYIKNSTCLLDLGSGPGRYSVELLKKGYNVTLLDLSDKSLEIAKERITSLSLAADDYIVSSATEIMFKENSFDAVLCLGPMYHLLDENDREKVLSGIRKILKPGGTAIIAYINSYGLFRSSVTEFPEDFTDETLIQAVKGNMKLSQDESFTETFFTTPKSALKEVSNSGLKIITYAGAESFLSGLHYQMNDLKESNPDIYNKYIELASKNCELEHYRETTEHLLIVARNEL